MNTNITIDENYQETRPEKMARELMETPFEELQKKYGNKLFAEVFIQKEEEDYTSVADQINMLRHLFILKFWPQEKSVLLDSGKRKGIVDLFSSITPENSPAQVNDWLKEIDQNLNLPQEFDMGELHNKAVKFKLAYTTIENLILDNFSQDYMPDVIHFTKMTLERLNETSQIINVISEKLDTQYQKLLLTKDFSLVKIDDNILNEAVDVLTKIGRSQLFVTEEKAKRSLGRLAEIFIKLDFAIKIAIDLKQTNPNTNISTELALEATKKHLRPNINL